MVAKEDSDSGSASSLPPGEALVRFKKLLNSEVTNGHIAKKRRVAKEGRVDERSIQPLTSENVQTEPKNASTLDDLLPPRKKSAHHKSQASDTSQPWDIMQAHFSRKLNEESREPCGKRNWLEANNEEFKNAWPQGVWLTTNSALPELGSGLSSFKVRPKLAGLWQEQHPDYAQDFGSNRQKCIFALMRSYSDLLYTDYPYPQREDEEDQILEAALLHSLDHVAATAQKIKKNNDALKLQPEMEVPRDQGFTRPKVLILLPMRNLAFKAINRLLSFAQKETRSDSIQNKARFQKDFGPGDREEEERKKGEPADHAAMFCGNTDDHFILGIKLTRGAVKLYADFYQSDIIVASPIALATKQAESEGEALQTLDFLSSIEILIAARCDVFEMQNWAHVISVFEALNQIPKENSGADIMRVQEWYLAGQAQSYRQNILLSSLPSPHLNAIFNAFCSSHTGKIKLQINYQGVLKSLKVHQIRQMYNRIPAKLPSDEPELRMAHFKTQIWPRMRDSGATGQMIVVPSYYDYVRLRNLFRAEDVKFEALTEYAPGSEVARGRSRFASSQTRFALYTERAHFYHRRRTRGVRDLFFYQLPQHPQFYKELVECLATNDDQDNSHATVTVLFSKFDAMRLERIVGSETAKPMLTKKSGTFLYC